MMGRAFRSRAQRVLRAVLVAAVLCAARPSVAEASFWCWLFGDCGGNGQGGSTTTEQPEPLRATPEVDPGTFASAIALAAGGAAMLGDRVRRRR